jgi:Tfp pilus assembly protein PilF
MNGKLYAPILVLVGSLAAATSGAMGDEPLVVEGNRLWAEQQFEPAESRYRQAIAESPESPTAHRQLAALLLAQGRNRDAIEAYQTAITLDPGNAGLFAALAVAYVHEGSFSAARAMCQQALQLDPEVAGAQSLLQYIEAKADAAPF